MLKGMMYKIKKIKQSEAIQARIIMGIMVLIIISAAIMTEIEKIPNQVTYYLTVIAFFLLFIAMIKDNKAEKAERAERKKKKKI